MSVNNNPGGTAGVLLQTVAEQVIGNSSAETVVGSTYRSPAFGFGVGQVLKWRVRARVTANGSGETLTLKLYLHGVLVDTIVLTTAALSAALARWEGEVVVRQVVDATTSPVDVTAGKVVASHGGSGSAASVIPAVSVDGSPTSVDFSTFDLKDKGQACQMTLKWSAASAGDSVAVESARMEME